MKINKGQIVKFSDFPAYRRWYAQQWNEASAHDMARYWNENTRFDVDVEVPELEAVFVWDHPKRRMGARIPVRFLEPVE